MNFPTQFDKRVRHHCRPGARMKRMFSPAFDSDGNFELVESGTADLYDEIQSHRDSVDIQVLLKRYRDGDSLALERVQGMYGDFSNMPSTYSGMLNSMLKSREIFDSLPVEIRARFDHSFEQFISSMDDPALFNKLVAQEDTTKQDPATTDDGGVTE